MWVQLVGCMVAHELVAELYPGADMIVTSAAFGLLITYKWRGRSDA